MTLHAKLDKLIQCKLGPQPQKKKLTCFNCGQEGHFTNHCSYSKENKEGVPKGNDSWKQVAPKNGKPKQKCFKGKLCKWCGKCAQ